jgi:uncharacterized protein (DUF1684 family)
MMNRVNRWPLGGLLLALGLACAAGAAAMEDGGQAGAQGDDAHRLSVEDWRARRHARLSSPDGWLTLVGLEWLKEGENRAGSAEDNDIVLAGGAAHWGSVFLEGETLRFVSGDTQAVTINGEHLGESALVADVQGEPTVVASDTVSFHVIFRESYALRVKDSQAPGLLNFKGVDNYPISADWRIEGSFIPAEAGTVVEISNVLGQVSEMPVYGTFEFEKDGRNHRLLGLGDARSKSLWFIFADRTSGRGTYGAGRFLYSDGMPADGQLVVDFNMAYNPPCAFNEYSTCPLPPQANRLDVHVTAGEKDYHAAGH